jgi:excisionase family DNA binding protein
MLNKDTHLVSPKELSEILNVPVSWCYRQASEGRLPAVKVGKYLRFNLADVQKFIKVIGGRNETG